MTSYLVTVDIGVEGPDLDLDDPRLAKCSQLLGDHYGTVTAAPGIWSAAVTIEAATPRAAISAAEELVRPASDRARLPAGPILRVEIVKRPLP
jgi:hypothetical protein